MSPEDSAAEKRYVVKALTLVVAAILIASPLGIISSIIAPAEAQQAPQLPVLSQQAQQLPREQRNWEYLMGNRLGGNYNPQKVITKDNVQNLELRWMYPIPSSTKIAGQNLVGFGAYLEGSMAPPLIVDGVAYIILNSKTVIAVDAKTGKQLWIAPATANNTRTNFQTGRTLPMTTENSHTHGTNYIDGLLWFADYECSISALDAKTGKVAKSFRRLCGEIPLDDPRGMGVPGNSGLYGSLFPFPPTAYKAGNLIMTGFGGSAEGTWGGRLYFAAYDVNTGKLAWRTFLVPPCGDPKTCGPGKDGPLFVKERQEWGQWLVDNCNKIWIQQIKACDLDRDMLRNDWGDMRSNSGVSQVWNSPLVDEEAGIVYIGTAQPGPDWNATYAPYFRLFGSSILALNAKTGEMIWAHQTTTRDLWDYDCTWNGALTTTMVKGQMKKVYMKGCKNGIVYVLDAATGEALHSLESPSIKRTPNAQLLNPRSKGDMVKPWQHYPSTTPVWQNCPGTGCLESDLAFDPERNMVYFATYNAPGLLQIIPVESRGQFGQRAVPNAPPVPTNYTLNAYNVDTGQLVWQYHSNSAPGYRGGVMTSGGVVYTNAIDGFLRGHDADTGKVLFEKAIPSTSAVMPTMGADSDGKMRLFFIIGGAGSWRGPDTPGAIMTYGLPDKLPEPQVITKEVIKEVPKEVIKEVPKEVTVETISPISYGIVGLGIAIAVVGIVLSRRKKA
jgi:quinohemoprotein ethanol dehydrogenase